MWQGRYAHFLWQANLKSFYQNYDKDLHFDIFIDYDAPKQIRLIYYWSIINILLGPAKSMELSIGRIFITIWLIAYIHGNFPFLTPHHTRRKQQFSRFNRETTIDLANVSLLFPFLPPYNMLSAMSRCGSILSLLPRFTCVFW